MNIMHITKKYPPATGGDAVVVSNLVQEQRAAGHSVTVVTSRSVRQPTDSQVFTFGLADTPSNLDTITLRRLVSLCMLMFALFGLLRRERPHVIHTHSVDIAFFASLAARWYGIPIIHTFHIVTFYDHNQSALRRRTELWLAKNAAPRIVTAPNKYDVAQLQRGGLGQTVWLPNGINLPFWQVKRTPSGTFTFVSIGRLEKQKGYEYLIKAAGILAERLEPFRVIAVGDGAERKELEYLTFETQAPVEFVGNKSTAHVRDILAQADCVVIPSLYETTPLTLLEAWAAGVPVIATPVGILRTAAPDFLAAYVVPAKDPSALADAMQQCMRDHAGRATKAEQGRREVANYTWPDIAQTAENLYRSLV